MKAHTNDYKDKIKLHGKQIDSLITYEIGGVTTELGKEELNSVTPHYEGSILKSVMRQLDIDSNVDIPIGTILNYQFGLFVDRYYETTDETYQADTNYYELDDDEYVLLVVGTDYTVGDSITDTIYNYTDYEYVNYGNYIVYSNEKQEDTNSYKIVCYDKLLYSMVDYAKYRLTKDTTFIGGKTYYQYINDNYTQYTGSTEGNPSELSLYERLDITYPINIREYIGVICNWLGLTFKNSANTFANYNRTIQSELFLDNSGKSIGYKFRDVFDQLAEVTASTICINEDDDELEIRYINDSYDEIDEEYLKNVNVNFGQKYGPVNSIVLSRSAESDNVYIQDAQSIQDNGLTEIKIKDNQFMNFNDRSSYLPDLLARLGGLQYYLNDFSSTGITYYNLCDRYNASIRDNTYSCIMFNDEVDITQGLEELVNTKMPEETETDYSKADKTDMKINQTYLIVDKQNQTISSVVSNVTEQNNKISQITQTVDELNSKISDIADITISGESTEATFNLANINESEPIMIKVNPINALNNISYLYPKNNLYPSSSLYMPSRKIRFTNNTDYEQTQDTTYKSYRKYYTYDSSTEEYTLLVAGTDYNNGDTITGTKYQNKEIDYELPDDLLYYDADHYDEFYLDYDSHTCQVTKRCQYSADGSVSALANERIDTYTYPTIALTDGDYTISLIGYNYGYLFARLMSKNIYTSQFYTKVETDSQIQQTANSITESVNARFTNYSDTTEMNTAITQKIQDNNNAYVAVEVAKKVNNTDYKKATIIAKINDNTSQAQINADNIDINANDVLNILSGNTINLTSKNIAINSTNFQVTTDGILTANKGIFKGSIETTDNANNRIFISKDNTGIKVLPYTTNKGTTIGPGYITCETITDNDYTTMNQDGFSYSGSSGYPYVTIQKSDGAGWIRLSDTSGSQKIRMYGSNGNIYCAHVYESSEKEKKKNLKKLEKALDIIKNIDIYKYNMKDEDDNDKKHIGFVIGDEYNYSKEITSKGNEGVDIYSFVSVCCKAIQEQQEQIEKLEERISQLERNDK